MTTNRGVEVFETRIAASLHSYRIPEHFTPTRLLVRGQQGFESGGGARAAPPNGGFATTDEEITVGGVLGKEARQRVR